MIVFFIIIILLIFFTYLVTKWFLNNQPTRHSNVPPSPPKFPILGNLHQLGFHPYRTLHSLSQRYGPLMLLHLGSKPALVVSSPHVAQEITKKHDLVFASRPKLVIGDKLFYNSRDVVCAPYGEYWRQMKSICVVQLLSTKRVASFREVREEQVGLLIKNIKQLSNLCLPVNLSEMFTSLSRDVICKVALGTKYESGDENNTKFKRLVKEFMDLLGSFSVGEFIPWLSWVNNVNGFNKRVDRLGVEIDEFLDGVVQEHVVKMEERSKLSDNNNNNGSGLKDGTIDFVDVLLELHKENNGDSPLDTQSIKALILDMFLGGTDTSSTALEWAMTELIRHPRVMMILQNEVRKLSYNNPDGIITESDLDKMHYLKMVTKETLRFHPPFPLQAPREATQDVNVMGYDIAAKTLLFVNIWSLARDPAYWDRPDEFRPERFLDSNVEFKGHDFQFIPFGSGRRGCPGAQFAVVILELVLANLVKIFDWSLPDGAMGENLDVTEGSGFAAHRKHPLVAIATPTSHFST